MKSTKMSASGGKYVLGLDVGGTKIAVALIDPSYKVYKAKVFPTSKNNLSKQLVKIIEGYDGFYAIGIGVPGQVLSDGTVLKLPNLKKFKRTNLKKVLENKFSVPVNVMNDAQAFTLAEGTVGGAKGFKRAAGVIMGTGIGGGVLINGKIYTGDKYVHGGEWGWVKVRSKVTLEQAMHKFGKFTSAEHSSPFAEVVIASILQVLSPQVIVFGGGRVNFPGIEKVLQRSLKTVAPSSKLKVKVSKLKYPGIIGAVVPLLKK